MERFSNKSGKLVLIFAVLFIAQLSQAADFRRVTVGKTLPEFSIKDLENNIYTLNELKGYDSLIVFWNIPETEMHRDYSLAGIIAVQNMYSLYGREKGLKVLAIYIPKHDNQVEEREIEAIKDLREKYRLDLPLLIDSGLKLFDLFGVNAAPCTILLNKEGIVTFTLSSYPWSAEKALKKAVNQQLPYCDSPPKYASLPKEGSFKYQKKNFSKYSSKSKSRSQVKKNIPFYQFLEPCCKPVIVNQ